MQILVKLPRRNPYTAGITPDRRAVLPAEAAIISAFEELKTRHAQSLEASTITLNNKQTVRVKFSLMAKARTSMPEWCSLQYQTTCRFDIVTQQLNTIPYRRQNSKFIQQDIRDSVILKGPVTLLLCNVCQLQRHAVIRSFSGYGYSVKPTDNGVKPTVIEKKSRFIYKRVSDRISVPPSFC